MPTSVATAAARWDRQTRLIVILRWVERLTTREISCLTGLDQFAVACRLAYALLMVRDALAAENPSQPARSDRHD